MYVQIRRECADDSSSSQVKNSSIIQVEDTRFASMDASNSKLGSYDYVCRKCQALKPLRAHHCKICQKCILKMDHHCPYVHQYFQSLMYGDRWVNNCIGARNQKYFLLFLFYVFLGEIYASLTGTYRLYKMITASNVCLVHL